MGSSRTVLHRAVRVLRRRPPLVAHSIIPLEVPILTETKRLWTTGHSADAVRYAYLHALDDLQRAFGVEFPATWTHEEIQVYGMTEAMGRLPDFFLALYRLYEPVRFGGRAPVDGNPVDLLQSIYAQAEMWQLYAPGLVARPAHERFEVPAHRPPAGAS